MSNKEKTAKAAPTFSKEQIVGFKRYAGRRDLLSVLLQEDRRYTTEQVEKLLADFMKTKSEVKK